MRNKEIESAAQDIAASLLSGENAIEASVGAVAALMASLPSMKNIAGLTVFHGQEVLEDATDLLAILAQARRKIGDLHRRLDATQRQIGLEPIAFGEQSASRPLCAK